MSAKIRVYVEVCLLSASVAEYAQVQSAVVSFLEHNLGTLTPGHVDLTGAEYLREHIQQIEVTELVSSSDDVVSAVAHADAELIVNVFKLSDEPPAEETTEDDENVTTCQQLQLPSTSLHGLWESLIFDSQVKRNVLEYAATAMLFSDVKVNPHIISWNRVVLLHGPPGTGKTSLCKALAQKLSIRLSQRYASGHLLEINAHSLFSKWFSESGKLVMKLFRQIQELVEDEDALVCVLIDEVESLTAARKAAMSGSEPSDAIRVVNALLTQLDSLKKFSNVLILTTSNITEAIDIAFVDRADIKQYIGLPSTQARYEILRSCLEELCRVGLVERGQDTKLLPFHEVDLARGSDSNPESGITTGSSGLRIVNLSASRALQRVAEAADGFSGRSLRKLPFQAHAFFVQNRRCHLRDFIASLGKTVDVEKTQQSLMKSG